MSSEKNHDKKSRYSEYLNFQRTQSRALMIPTILLAYPVAALLIGMWIDNRFDTSPWFLLLFLLAGFVEAAREILVITKSMEKDSESTDEGTEGNGDRK